MSRIARKKSSTKLYHVMMRGNNRQIVFKGEDDKAFFMKVLSECKERMDFELYAFCLMPNHIHLLIRENETPIERIFRCVGTRYASWFNRKYERVGHLFQDRFRSEAVEDKRYFLTVLRYIIQNPVKAGLADNPDNYPWNSYHEYFENDTSVVDTQFAIDLIGSREILIDYLQARTDETAMEIPEPKKRISMEESLRIMKTITHCSTQTEFLMLDELIRKQYIKEMLCAGLSMGRISAITGISKSAVYRSK